MRKRFLSLILAMIMIIAAAVPFTASANAKTASVKRSDSELPFTDVEKDSWCYEPIKYVFYNGLMVGVSDTLFGPSVETNRAMVVTILYKMAGTPEISGNGGFDDVPMNAYYAKPVAWASSVGLVSGYNDKTFGPNDVITREQAALILYKSAMFIGYDVSGRADLTKYSDCDQISFWAITALEWANHVGIISGTSETTISPKGHTIRAQIATMLMRYAELQENGDQIKNFKADEIYFLCGEESTITFTVEADENTTVELYKGSTSIGQMNDEGNNGDEVPNDGVYSYKLTKTVNSKTRITEKYHAVSDNEKSNIETIYFFTQSDVESTKDAILELEEAIENIENSFVIDDSNDQITYENAIDIYDRIIQLLNELEEQNQILYYETEGNYITVRFPTSYYIYEFDLRPTFQRFNKTISASDRNDIENYAETTGKKIVTLQPYANSLFSNVFDNAARHVDSSLDDYTFTHNIDEGSVSINGLKNLSGFDIIIWDGHGGYDSQTHSFMGTGETSANVNNYSADTVGRNPAIITLSGGRLGITSQFFTKYYGNSHFNNTLFFLGCCHTAEDDVLAETLINLGASCVYGYRNSVYSTYNRNMCSALFDSLSEFETDKSYTKTAREALTEAQNKHGAVDPTNEPQWWDYVLEFFGIITIDRSPKAELRLIGNNSFRLVDNAGTLSGKVTKASDRTTPVSGATVCIYQNLRLEQTVATDSAGNYSVTLEEGNYQVKITASGYLDFDSNASVTANETTFLETFLMINDTGDRSGKASGTVFNSLTGQGCEGVTLKVRKGWNSDQTFGDDVGSTVTASDGTYTLELPLGNYTVIASKDGYLTSSFNIIVQSGTTPNQNGTITPVISGNDYLITLTWGENPRDLDSHVEGKLSNGNPFHVYFRDKTRYDGDTKVCELDYDDTTSYGPEHITLKTNTDSPYYYYIHRYAGSESIATSEAKIRVQQGNTLVAEFNVPTNLGSGDYWNVFAIKDGRIIVNNTITSSPNTSYAD